MTKQWTKDEREVVMAEWLATGKENDRLRAENAVMLEHLTGLSEFLDLTLRPCVADCGCWACFIEAFLSERAAQ